MKHLSKLTPAETLIILEGEDASMRELIKVTFMDLLLKQVLKSAKISKQRHPRDKARVYNYIVIAKKFHTYQALPHETIFLDTFYKNPDIQILFTHIVKMGYQNSKSKLYYQPLISKNPAIADLFSSSFFTKLFGLVKLNEKGKELESIIVEEIKQLEKELPEFLINDKARALNILKIIGGNVFLLRNIDLSTLHQIDKALIDEINKKKTSIDHGGCAACWSDWHSYDSDAQSFDNGCSGGSGCSGGDSGGSGCAGDSGCGGGGCGGCGGGD